MKASLSDQKNKITPLNKFLIGYFMVYSCFFGVSLSILFGVAALLERGKGYLFASEVNRLLGINRKTTNICLTLQFSSSENIFT